MKLFITTNWPPDYHHGGVVYSGYNLYKSLKLVDDTWFCITTSSVKSQDNDVFTFKYVGSGKHGVSIGSIIYIFKTIKNKNVNFVFVNGTVTLLTVVAQVLSIIFNKTFVVSTRGALEPWRLQHKRSKKLLYFNLIVVPLLRKSKWIHVTSELERVNVSKILPNHLIKVFPNGINEICYLPNKNVGKTKLLFLSRISPEKGLDILLEIASKIQANILDFELTIVGPGATKFFKSDRNIKVLEGVFAEGKIKLFENCDIFILPSHSENFGNVVLESLACGRPVITTVATPWHDLESNNCGWITQPKASNVIELLFELQKIERVQFIDMGKNGIKFAEQFIWSKIASNINHDIKCHII